MALSSDEISNLNDKIANLNKDIEYDLGRWEEARNTLNSNENYQKFVAGTEYGTNLNEKLFKASNLLTSLFENEVTNISILLQELSDLQAKLNSLR